MTKLWPPKLQALPNFRRSLKYLRPYRLRLTVAIACVIIIACLWGGGLGMLLPGAKILMAPEGLHGWAYKMCAEDHLNAVIEEADPHRPIGGREINVLDIKRVDEGKAAAAAGLKKGDWIVGFDGKVRPAFETLQAIAKVGPGESIDLMVDARTAASDGRKTSQTQTVKVVAAKESPGAQALRYVAVGWIDRGPLLLEPKGSGDKFEIWIWFLLVVLVITVIRNLFTFIQEYLVGSAIWMGTMDMRSENYNKVLHLPTTFFSEKGVSDATSRFIQDTNELARGQNTLLGKTLVEPAKAIGALVMALAISWDLTLLTLIAGPLSFWMIRRFGKKMHKASKRALESWSLMLAVLGETLQGIRVVKAYTMEGAERRRFFRVNRQLVKQQNKKEMLDALTGPTVETLGMAACFVAAAVAGYLVFVGFGERRMDPFYFIAWLGTLFALFDPVRKMAKVWMRFAESEAAAKRIFDLQDIPEEPHVANAPTLPRHATSLEFRNVSFHYPNVAADAVKDVSLTIRAGQTVAIVGPNGSGKTTLVSLLPRLLDATSGQLLIDGHDISQVSVRSLRRQIGLVTQDTVLFHATIGENIAYGLRRPRQEDVLAASKKAFVDEFVREMPEGYQTMVGEHGATLSGGQKQRISIARAILRDPAILIFDEAMSQVDSNSERRIHEAMSEFMRGRTTLMIAHRFATVLSADLIMVMADGKLVDSGRHEDLLKRCELYYHLYRTQFLDSGGDQDKLQVSVETPAKADR